MRCFYNLQPVFFLTLSHSFEHMIGRWPRRHTVILRPSTHRLLGTSWPRVDTTGPQGTFQNSLCSWQRSSVIRGSVTRELCLGWALQLCVTCREPPGRTQSVTRSWDERGTPKAALPHMGLPRGPGLSPPSRRDRKGPCRQRFPSRSSRGPVCPFPLLSVVGLSSNFWK